MKARHPPICIGLCVGAICLTLAANPVARAADTPNVFWEPYAFDAATLGLFHCDANAAPGTVPEAPDLLGSVAKDLLLDAETPDRKALKNEAPMGTGAALVGAATQVAEGFRGGGVRLADETAYVAIPSGSALGTTEFWIKVEALPAKPLPLLSRRGRDAADELRLMLNPDGSLEVFLGQQGFGPSTWHLPAREWTHLAVALAWGFEFNGLLRVHANGEVVTEVKPHWDYRDNNQLAKLRDLRLGGVPGWLDEVRVSSSVRTYQPRELEVAVDLKGDRPLPAGQPFFRAADDLILRLGFDQELNAAPAPPGLVVKETALRIAGLGDRKEQRGFADGIHRDALMLGPDLAQPEYTAPKLLNSAAGAIAFWLRPLNWDNRTSVNHRMQGKRVRQLNLFRIFGETPSAIRKYRPIRGNDPSLLCFTVDITPDAAQGAPPPLRPGLWTHVVVTWQGDQKRLYVNGRPCGYAGMNALTHAYYRKSNNERDLKGEVFDGSEPTSLTFDGRSGDARTLIDDFRIYSRPLTAPEAANLANWFDPRHPPTPLPPVAAEFTYNGVAGEAVAVATPLLPEYGQVSRFALTLRREGDAAPVGTAQAETVAGGGTTVSLAPGPFGFGAYRLQLDALTAAGKVLASQTFAFERQPPPWWQSPAGKSEKVMPGWQPMTATGTCIRLAGREIYLAPSGLPAKIISADEDILAGPITLAGTAAGKPLELTPAGQAEIVSTKDVRVDARGGLDAPDLAIAVDSYTEFDGMMWFTLTLKPAPGRQPVVDTLTLTVPFRETNAQFVHWWSGERGFRNPKVVHIGALPTTPGVLFRSNDASVLTKVPAMRGSFIPYLLLSGDRRGLAWFAENDKGWTQSDTTPAVSVERRDTTVTLVLRLISTPVTLTTPRTLAFGLHPTPVKNPDPLWRQYPQPWNVIPDTFSANNLKGPAYTTFWLYPENGDWAAVKRRIDGEGLGGGAAGVKGLYLGQLKGLAEAGISNPPPQTIAVPGLYWDLQWNGLPPLTHTREWAATWALNYQYYTPEFVDFASWAWNDWIAKTDKFVQGAYIDDCWGAPLTLASGPTTYALPDGQIQPGFQFLGPRERFKRMRQISHDQGVWPHLTAHTTHTFFVPYHSFFDLILDGEDFYSSPPAQEDFIDHWPLERLRFMHHAKWGLVTTWLGWAGNSVPVGKYPAWTFRQERAYTAALALHDIAWRFDRKLLSGFGLKEPDTEFIPYWANSGLVAENRQPDAIKVGGWKRNGKYLILVVNVGKERADASLRLALPATAAIRDVDPTLVSYFADDPTTVQMPEIGAQSDAAKELLDDKPAGGKEFNLEARDADLPVAERKTKDPDGKFAWQNGVLTCPVRRHDYRLFEVSSAP